VTLPFIDTLIALTYLLTYLFSTMVVNSFINNNVITIYFTQMKQRTIPVVTFSVCAVDERVRS